LNEPLSPVPMWNSTTVPSGASRWAALWHHVVTAVSAYAKGPCRDAPVACTQRLFCPHADSVQPPMISDTNRWYTPSPVRRMLPPHDVYLEMLPPPYPLGHVAGSTRMTSHCGPPHGGKHAHVPSPRGTPLSAHAGAGGGGGADDETHRPDSLARMRGLAKKKTSLAATDAAREPHA
jgi:hypothetical protein